MHFFLKGFPDSCLPVGFAIGHSAFIHVLFRISTLGVLLKGETTLLTDYRVGLSGVF